MCGARHHLCTNSTIWILITVFYLGDCCRSTEEHPQMVAIRQQCAAAWPAWVSSLGSLRKGNLWAKWTLSNWEIRNLTIPWLVLFRYYTLKYYVTLAEKRATNTIDIMQIFLYFILLLLLCHSDIWSLWSGQRGKVIILYESIHVNVLENWKVYTQNTKQCKIYTHTSLQWALVL